MNFDISKLESHEPKTEAGKAESLRAMRNDYYKETVDPLVSSLVMEAIETMAKAASDGIRAGGKPEIVEYCHSVKAFGFLKLHMPNVTAESFRGMFSDAVEEIRVKENNESESEETEDESEGDSEETQVA